MTITLVADASVLRSMRSMRPVASSAAYGCVPYVRTTSIPSPATTPGRSHRRAVCVLPPIFPSTDPAWADTARHNSGSHGLQRGHRTNGRDRRSGLADAGQPEQLGESRRLVL